jgi:carboxyvinyl-carboxyphosphonate phosphorylmutase
LSSMNHTEQRQRLRILIAGTKAHTPASVFDPLSARVAEAVGYEIGLLAGSGLSATMLTAPDICLHTLTEYADQVRRIMRVSKLSLFVDADHGYGNALNVTRTVQELEHAGVSGLSIEDTALPISFSQAYGERRLLSIEEGVGKMRAALAARSDPSLVVVARTSALMIEGFESAMARAKAYAATGVDMLFVAGTVDTLEHLQAIYAVARLPMVMSSSRGAFKREDLAASGARILNPGHQVIAAAVKALRETYAHLYNGGAPEDLKSNIASPQEMEQLTDGENYRKWLPEYMH